MSLQGFPYDFPFDFHAEPSEDSGSGVDAWRMTSVATTGDMRLPLHFKSPSSMPRRQISTGSPGAEAGSPQYSRFDHDPGPPEGEESL